MRFFQFLESKFTEHSLSAQTEAFSIVRDGEQKATQTYMWLARALSKYWACVKLPLHFVACKIGLVAWPKTAECAVEEFTAKKKAEAEAAKLRAIEEGKKIALTPSPDQGLASGKAVTELKPKSKS